MTMRFLMAATAIALLAEGAVAQQVMGDPNGAYCREYTQEVIIGGVRRDSYGTSCQQPDGAWKMVSNDVGQEPAEEVQYVDQPVYITPSAYVPGPIYYAQPYPYYAPQPQPYYDRRYYGSSVTFGGGGYRGRSGSYIGYGRSW